MMCTDVESTTGLAHSGVLPVVGGDRDPSTLISEQRDNRR